MLRNAEWLFSGIGVFALALIIRKLARGKKKSTNIKQKQNSGSMYQNIQVGRDINISIVSPSERAQLQEPEDLWVNFKYVENAGITDRLQCQGYQVYWSAANKEAMRVNQEGWEVVVDELNDGRRVRYKVHDNSVGGYIVLLKKKGKTSKS